MMLTRCPSCHTAFRVTPEQLKARAGKVRCGHCSATFNALETLEEGAPATPLTPAPTAEEAATPQAQPEEAPAPYEDTPPPQDDALSPHQAAPVPDELLQEDNDTVVAEILSDEPTATIVFAKPRPMRWRIAAWSLGLLTLTSLLSAQVIYSFRMELVLLQPDWRPTLEGWCAALGCTLPLPRNPELVGIESSDLHPDSTAKNLLVLSATIKNRAPYAQAYPHLELTLTDTRDQALARRVFLPTDFVVGNDKLRVGLAQNAELAVNLWLDAASVPATGYRLYLFYP